jgi:hypothetical protein
MVLAGEAVRPFPCPAPLRQVPPLRARQPLSASDVGAELAGHTLYSDSMQMFAIFGGHFAAYLASDGVLYGTHTAEFDRSTRGAPKHDVGRWRITPDGEFCSQWHVWGNQREQCSAVYREGEIFTLERQGRFDREVYRRVPGNPEGY